MGIRGNVHESFAVIPWRRVLQWIVTGNETWVHHYEPTSKCHCMDWKHTSLPRNKKFKSVLSAGKVMLTLSLDLMCPSLSTTRNMD